MAKNRRDGKFDPVGVRGALVTTFHTEYPDGLVFPEHYHEVDQIVFASQGVMTVQTPQGIWVLPTNRALWIPAGITHMVRMSGIVSVRNLYFRPHLAPGMPRTCCVVNISPLLKELILQACQFPALNKRRQIQRHLIGLIVELLRSSQLLPLQLPQPNDPRAQKVANLLLSDPATSMPTHEVCRLAGASKRTVERLFLHDIHMTLGRWKQQLRLVHSLRLLAQGLKITSVAIEAGYSSPSAFISMFKNLLGTTPGLYFRADTRNLA
ncbi:MAG: helix-turn-helix transcriptional regulator [Candidatus Acidiferrum sp.]